MELLLLPVFQLIYFVSHFLYSLAQNVVSTWHLLTAVWHSTFDKISKSGLYKSTSGAHASDPRGTASNREVPGSLPQLWVSSVWSAIRRFQGTVALSAGYFFKTDRGNESAADKMTSGAHSSDPRETPADWEVPGSLPKLLVLAVWSLVCRSVRYLTTYQRDFVKSLRSRWCPTSNKNHSATYTKGLAKTPRHLGVVLGQPSPSVALVASLIAQAASYGVKYVSIYDAFGEFLRRKDDVLEEVKKVAGGTYCFRERESERELERGTESEGGARREELERENEGRSENSLEKSTENSATGKSEGSENSPDIFGEGYPENRQDVSRKSEKSPENSQGVSRKSEKLAENSPEKSENSGKSENSPAEKSEVSPENYGESETSAENPENSPEKSDRSPENSPENSDARPVVEIKFMGVQDGRQRLAVVAETLARDYARNFHLWDQNSENFSSENSGSEILAPGLRKRLKNVAVESSGNSALKIPENSAVKIPENSAVKIPENSAVKIPENSMVKIPENSAVKIPENSAGKIPENSAVKIPENSTVKIPENSTVKIPENSTVKIPENSTVKIPENSEDKIPENSGTPKTSPEYPSEISGQASLGLSNPRVISDSLGELSNTPFLELSESGETSESLSLNPKSRESSHAAKTPRESREFSAISTLMTPTAIPVDPKSGETYIPTLTYPKPTLDSSKPTLGCSKLTLDSSRLTLEPTKHTLDPYKLTLNPSKPTLGPTKPTLGPTKLTLGPSKPSISIADISQLLTRDFPDPEVLISLGSKSTLGYPPWELRATEIHFLGLSEAYLGLARVMEAYAGCEQRWGR